METYTLNAIGQISTPFTEKFGIPRQPGLVRSARGIITFTPPYHREEYFRGLEGFSHLWLVFIFHQHTSAELTPTIRPPRLGGNKRIGVFASRSSFRPNHCGQSVVKLEAIHQQDNKVSLEVSGIDLLDKTPILDIKPYLPYCDSVTATEGYLPQTDIPNLQVQFSSETAAQIATLETAARPHLKNLITEVLAQDPRPAYHAKTQSEREYGIQLYDLNIRFTVMNACIVVIQIALQTTHR